ncbi:MAG: proteasome subunit beta [Acidimicrobiales bacterium]|nr:MAG: proteasome subunit beta [Acidimicrobiales bacterium]
MFRPGEDPGPDFLALLHKTGMVPDLASMAAHVAGPPAGVTHGTTVVAVRYAEGVVLAGDRRATSGHLIAHRAIEKVFPADRYSGVAIAGAAGPAMEMVRLFQLQLEHYEKVEGVPLSLEGKANQLAMLVRNHFPAALQGLGVVPIFAGYDERRGVGRLFEYDVTGGRYEESEYAASGSGSLHASTVVKLGYREGMSRAEVLDLVISALFQAADEDVATGGPDLVRGIYPTVALVTREGFQRLQDQVVAETFKNLLDRLGLSDRGSDR